MRGRELGQGSRRHWVRGGAAAAADMNASFVGGGGEGEKPGKSPRGDGGRGPPEHRTPGPKQYKGWRALLPRCARGANFGYTWGPSR